MLDAPESFQGQHHSRTLTDTKPDTDSLEVGMADLGFILGSGLDKALL